MSSVRRKEKALRPATFTMEEDTERIKGVRDKWVIAVLIVGLLFAFTIKVSISEQLPPILNIGTHPGGSFFDVMGTAVATVRLR